jgi:DNA-binding response OmpR family regulator
VAVSRSFGIRAPKPYFTQTGTVFREPLQAEIYNKNLIVDVSEAEAFLIETLFRDSDGFAGELAHVTDMKDARNHLETGGFDTAFIDHYPGNETGTKLIRGLGGRRCQTPIVMLSGLNSAEVEAEARAAGAMDYVDKNLLSTGLLDLTVGFVPKNHEQTLQARSN